MLQLIIFRGLQGVGGGGLLTLVLIIVSDIVSLKDRGKYQGASLLTPLASLERALTSRARPGLTEATILVGNGAGPILGGVMAQKLTWQWCFWISASSLFLAHSVHAPLIVLELVEMPARTPRLFLVEQPTHPVPQLHQHYLISESRALTLLERADLPIGGVAMAVILFFLPLKAVRGSMKQYVLVPSPLAQAPVDILRRLRRRKLLQIDYGGALLSSFATVLVILPLNWGGVSFPWVSGPVLGCLISGIVGYVVFVMYEWRVAKIPIVPRASSSPP